MHESSKTLNFVPANNTSLKVYTFLEGLKVPGDDGGVNVRERLHGGKRDIEDAEEGHKPRVHFIPPSSGLREHKIVSPHYDKMSVSTLHTFPMAAMNWMSLNIFQLRSLPLSYMPPFSSSNFSRAMGC